MCSSRAPQNSRADYHYSRFLWDKLLSLARRLAKSSWIEKDLVILGFRSLLRLFLDYPQLFALTTGLRRNRKRHAF